MAEEYKQNIHKHSIGGRVFTHWQTICSSVIYKRERVVKRVWRNGNGFSSNGFQSANAIYMTSIRVTKEPQTEHATGGKILPF